MRTSIASHRPCRFGLPLLALLIMGCMSQGVLAAATDGGSGQTVECMLPGQIHSIGGHPTMGPRHAVQTTTEDCQQRGGEYTASTEPVASPAAVAGTDSTNIRCQLPRQTRQLGSKTRYSTRSRIIHTTAADCQTKQGKVLAAKATH
jgi:hypothetical protein